MPNLSAASDTIKEMKLRLRRECRLKRQSLNDLELQQTSLLIKQQFFDHFTDYITNHKFKKIALYIHQDNELGTGDLLPSLLLAGYELYLPKITSSAEYEMSFVQYDERSSLVKNQFGIKEPEYTTTVAIEDLDLILLPLTAFDLKGNRLGMGGGFYDRALAKSSSKNTMLVGLAYDFQQIESCPVEYFDQPLDRILTPTRMLDFTLN